MKTSYIIQIYSIQTIELNVHCKSNTQKKTQEKNPELSKEFLDMIPKTPP